LKSQVLSLISIYTTYSYFQRDTQALQARRRELEATNRAERDYVLHLESERNQVQDDYLRVSRAAMREQSWRFHNLLMAGIDNEVGNEVTVVTDDWLPENVTYDFCESLFLIIILLLRCCAEHSTLVNVNGDYLPCCS
jgi:hypothetical protein